MGFDTKLTSSNSTYHTKTGGTHTSNVHHANSDRTSKTFKKGTIDLATVNSHKVAGGAGGSAGPSRSSAGAAGGLAAGGHGGTGGHVIIHHQAPPPPPDTLTSTELLGAAIGSTIAIILIIIAGAITCRSVYRDQARSFRKRRDKKSAKRTRDMESASVASRSEEIERLTSVLPDVTVPPAQQGAPHRRATEMLNAMTPLSQTCAIDSAKEKETGLLKTTVQHAPVPSAPPMEHKSARCQRRHVSSSDSDLSPIPHREPRIARAWGPSRNQSRSHNKSHRLTALRETEPQDTGLATYFPSSTATRAEDSTGKGPRSSSPLTPRAPVMAPSRSLLTTAIVPTTKTNDTVTSGCLCRTGMQPAQLFTSEPTLSSTGTGPSRPSILPMSGGQETGLQDQDHRRFQHLNQTIDTQQQLINQLLQGLQAQKMMGVSLTPTKRSSTTATPSTPDFNPHRSLHTAGDRKQTRRDPERPQSTSAATTEPPATPKTDDDDED